MTDAAFIKKAIKAGELPEEGELLLPKYESLYNALGPALILNYSVYEYSYGLKRLYVRILIDNQIITKYHPALNKHFLRVGT